MDCSVSKIWLSRKPSHSQQTHKLATFEHLRLIETSQSSSAYLLAIHVKVTSEDWILSSVSRWQTNISGFSEIRDLYDMCRQMGNGNVCGWGSILGDKVIELST